ASQVTAWADKMNWKTPFVWINTLRRHATSSGSCTCRTGRRIEQRTSFELRYWMIPSLWRPRITLESCTRAKEETRKLLNCSVKRLTIGQLMPRPTRISAWFWLDKENTRKPKKKFVLLCVSHQLS